MPPKRKATPLKGRPKAKARVSTKGKASLSPSPSKKSPKSSTKAESKEETKEAPKLHAELDVKLAEYRAKRKFNAKKWIAEKCKAFNEYMKSNGLTACVVSLSGGVDSAVTLGLMKHASKLKGSVIKRVAAIAQPIHSSGWALARATEAAEDLDVELFTVDQTDQHKRLQKLVDTAVGIEGKPFATGQLRSYMRTPVGYYVAQLLSQEGTPCIVLGTGNMDEDGYLLYYCKAGDGVVDVQLIADLHKSEVFKIGHELKVPNSILIAPPSADLWDGQTDEEELGLTYDFIELFTGYFLTMDPEDQAKFKKSLSKPALTQFESWAEKAAAVHKRNSHKAGGPKNL